MIVLGDWNQSRNWKYMPIRIFFFACATSVCINELVMASYAECVREFCLSKNQQIIQRKVESCNAIPTTLPYEMFEKGPPVVRNLLDAPVNADKRELIKIIQDRSRETHTARQQALAVLKLPWYTPNSILHQRIRVIDQTLFAMHCLDESVSPHGRNYAYTYFRWFPHINQE